MIIPVWNNYRDTFPSRYIEAGYFDDYIKKIISDKKPKMILDIGGGVTGTKALRDSGADIYLLDPYISIKPEWIKEKINWNTDQKFDIIIARGSINYLTREELSKIKELLNPKGIFIANTFLSPPSENWSERPYATTSGAKGVERYRYNPRTKTVEHELVPESGDKISHSFYYYSRDDYNQLFPGIKTIEHRSNSTILYFEL